ncbi:hypothetical protein E2C00_33065 [Streptomyces sp. WAC05374]|uniref:hypothetical protein n=1 Tax=Streptomyces sp. WAC05374 TaxID=2487420 RepID=UPI000F866BA2|nr:hypothetical protein [Streptomyces sp. WAC05374]RST16886.1 hypothetical protein EF905_11080 [Streptomyces sp. WAC05374]TDF36836.1 hypothetical protein E2B92_30715 [Streptomyces sp. WAC05374]TDF46288.1 hypothetical protein E2C02_32235 [Streptomyces sp. WAC05374]TDF46889.1 hypothetical protein E2C00_33065 [Streptomyces sp. WAC05374]
MFDNIFNSAAKGAGLFSVTTDSTKSRPGEDVDFEDSDDDTYDDTSPSLFNSAIHGASSRSKIVQETSPEARAVLGILGSFIRTTQASAGEQGRYAQDPGSVTKAASAGMQDGSATVKEYGDLKKDEDLKERPKKSDFTKPPKTPDAPKAPEAPKAPQATAEKPTRSE